MRRTLPVTLTVVLLLSLPLALAGDDTADHDPPGGETEPGRLEVLSGTAVSLDGELPEGIEEAAFLWTIVSGEGGRLFNSQGERFLEGVDCSLRVSTDPSIGTVGCQKQHHSASVSRGRGHPARVAIGAVLRRC